MIKFLRPDRVSFYERTETYIELVVDGVHLFWKIEEGFSLEELNSVAASIEHSIWT